MLGEPAHEAARVAEVVAVSLEVCGVDEILDELEICRSTNSLSYLTSY